MVEVIQLNDPAWAAFVDAHPDATCFHRPQWSQLLADCYRYPGFVVVERERSGTILAGMPVLEVRQLTLRRRWACLPFSDECGPLVSSAGSAATLLAGATSCGGEPMWTILDTRRNQRHRLGIASGRSDPLPPAVPRSRRGFRRLQQQRPPQRAQGAAHRCDDSPRAGTGRCRAVLFSAPQTATAAGRAIRPRYFHAWNR